MSTYKKLTDYISYFEKENIEFYKWNSWIPEYDEKVEQFISDIYNTNLLKTDYLTYLEIEKEDRDIANMIPTADLEMLRAILTFYVRSERFCDGSWAGAIKKKVFLRILYRLKELDQ